MQVVERKQKLCQILKIHGLQVKCKNRMRELCFKELLDSQSANVKFQG